MVFLKVLRLENTPILVMDEVPEILLLLLDSVRVVYASSSRNVYFL